jgi:hypothetical protein
MSMQKHNNISSLWEIMSQEKSVGLVKRLLPNNSPLKVFATYKHPENICGIAFSCDSKLKLSIDSFYNLKELSVQLFLDTSYQPNKLLTIQLFSDANTDIFAYLCGNLVETIERCDTEAKAIKLVLNRLEKWKTMFSKGASDGLSITEQQGLYGELMYLHKLVLRGIFSYIDTLKIWVGADKAMRDFQGKDWAVEAKTISINNADQITINGERQLDETLLDKLYLYHLSVEASRMNGQTLNEKVDELRSLFSDDKAALNIFNAKLMEAGYFDHHRELYRERCYNIRKESIYVIDDSFPRIKESELRDGVSNTVYSINVSTCAEYMVSENTHFNSIE